jgi:hypothetical protein
MGLVVPNDVVANILDTFLTTADLKLKLFSNNYTPIKTSDVTDFTEVAGGGYAEITLDKDEWTITPLDVSTATQAEKTFTFTGATSAPGTVYGYYVVDAGGVLLWAERFSAIVVPFTPENGSTIAITPRITGESLF